MKTARKAVEITSTSVPKITTPLVVQDSNPQLGQNTYGFYNYPPPIRRDDKRQPKPNGNIIANSVLLSRPVNAEPAGGRVWGNRVSDSDDGTVVLTETISKGMDVIGSPCKSLDQKLKEEVKDIISPNKVTITQKNPETGSPWHVTKNTPKQTKFVRSFSVLLFLGEDSKQAVIKATVFQSEKSAREVKKKGKVSKDIETIRIRLVLPKYDAYILPERKATKKGLRDAEKENRIVSSKVRGDDAAFLSGETGAHEQSHLAQRRIFGNASAAPAEPFQIKGKRKILSDAAASPAKRYKPEDEKVTIPASYEHNSMRTLGPEHRIVFDYINAGADMAYSNYVELFNHVIDREFPQWRMGSNKIKFNLVARNEFSPKKVTPAKQLGPVSKTLYKFVFGSPKKAKAPEDALDEAKMTTLVL